MRHFIAAALLAAGSAHSFPLVAQNGDDSVRLANAPCTVASVLRFIKPEARPEFRRADGKIGGQRYFGCFVIVGDTVVLVWEDGDFGEIRFSSFQEDGV